MPFVDSLFGCAIVVTADSRFVVGPVTAAYPVVNLASGYQVGVAMFGSTGSLVDSGFSLTAIC